MSTETPTKKALQRLRSSFGRGGGGATTSQSLPVEGELPSFEGATQWINSKPITREELSGRVVLVCFGTYTCINWIRALPYVRAWAEKYAGNGLVVIGVQTPEFEFEGSLDNVHRAVEQMDVSFPLVVDNEYAIWRAFDNNYWPALYFIDAGGQIRHHHYGEGDYEESERVLQTLLAGTGPGVMKERANVDTALVRLEPQGVELPADWENLGSAENYVGYTRTEGFSSPGGLVPGEPNVYRTPSSLRLNEWALSGDWRIGAVAAVSEGPGGVISCRFHARDLHLVMRPAMGQASTSFRVRIDGGSPGDSHGTDVDENGTGVLMDQRMYQLLRQPGPIIDRLFEIEFVDAGVEAYVFTFG
ncbi:MAG TPA: redoxin domain-containing protein [Acidimicrobiales bacterium]|nr:redoxin domain-containing protein [Acidimicrobiales bacterium]